MTVLHGFPSSSHDWARAAPHLATDHALLLPDFLGFGASDKPADHHYSLTEQADLIEALWAHEGVVSTVRRWPPGQPGRAGAQASARFPPASKPQWGGLVIVVVWLLPLHVPHRLGHRFVVELVRNE